MICNDEDAPSADKMPHSHFEAWIFGISSVLQLRGKGHYYSVLQYYYIVQYFPGDWEGRFTNPINPGWQGFEPWKRVLRILICVRAETSLCRMDL